MKTAMAVMTCAMPGYLVSAILQGAIAGSSTWILEMYRMSLRMPSPSMWSPHSTVALMCFVQGLIIMEALFNSKVPLLNKGVEWGVGLGGMVRVVSEARPQRGISHGWYEKGGYHQ